VARVNSHPQFYNGVPRPHWAGAVHSISRQRISGLNQVSRSAEISGLVIPVSMGPSASPHSFGQSLGFPDLREHLTDLEPEIWKNWTRLEQAVSQAAASLMQWKGPGHPRQAFLSGVPENVLQLRASARTLKSTAPENTGQLLRPAAISGEVSKLFAIRDVSGSQLRFESACSTCSFQITPSSVHWSRDPRTL